MEIKYKRILAQIGRFFISGGLGLLLYYGVWLWLTYDLRILYLWSIVGGFLAQQSINFPLQKYWVFKNLSREKRNRQMVIFLLYNVAIFGINFGVLWYFVDKVGYDKILTQIILTVILSTISYFLYRKIFPNITPQDL